MLALIFNLGDLKLNDLFLVANLDVFLLELARLHVLELFEKQLDVVRKS